MKKSLSLFGLLFTAAAAFAQPYNLTIQVDMKNEVVDPAGVSAAGDFQGSIVTGGTVWTPGQVMLTENPVGSKKYSVTVALSVADTFAFKIVNGPSGWEGVPGACNVGGNRSVIVAGASTVAPSFCYGSCVACPSTVDTLNVRFQVDMTNMEALYAAPHHDTVTIAGDFAAAIVNGTYQNWSPGAILLTRTAPGSKIYQTPVFRMKSGNYSYKFLYGPSWGYDENFSGPCKTGSNRELTIAGITNSNVTVGPFCFNSCDPTCSALGNPRPVKFTVDATDEAAATYSIGGTMQLKAFTGNLLNMIDNGNGTFSKTMNMYPGDYQYIYFQNDGVTTASEGFAPAGCSQAIPGPVGGVRRTMTVPGDATSLFEVNCFKYNTCTFCTAPFNAAEAKKSAAYFTAQPNPFNGSTRISFSNLENAKFNVVVTDVTGRVVSTQMNLSGNTATIQDLKAGVFFATLTTENGTRYTQKLVAE
jgi:hypothetical protein